MKTLKIVLPLPPNRGNARQHWRVRLNEKKAYREKAYWAIHAQRKQRAWGPATKELYVCGAATLYVWNLLDDDNAVARLKDVLDALRRNRLIWDDKRPWFRLGGIPEQVIDRKHPRVEITLTTEAA